MRRFLARAAILAVAAGALTVAVTPTASAAPNVCVFVAVTNNMMDPGGVSTGDQCVPIPATDCLGSSVSWEQYVVVTWDVCFVGP